MRSGWADAAHAEEKHITNPRRPPILALAIAPGNSKAFFAAFRDQRSAWFAISTDLGKTWGNHTPLPQGTHRLLVDPRRVSRFLTSTLAAKYPWLPARVESGSKSALRLAQKNDRR